MTDDGGSPGHPSGVGAVEAGSPDVEAVLSEEGVKRWGRRLGRAAAEHGLFVGLRGPLGAGKTTLVRAAAAGAGVGQRIRSPTYTLHHLHGDEDGRRFHHVDLYRLPDPADVDDLGWEDLVASGEPVFVEWAGRAGNRLPARRWDVRLDFVGRNDRRRVQARSRGGAPPVPAPEENAC